MHKLFFSSSKIWWQFRSFWLFNSFNNHSNSTIIHSFILHYSPRHVFLYPHRFFAQREKNLHGVPNRESNSDLPYSKPTHYSTNWATPLPLHLWRWRNRSNDKVFPTDVSLDEVPRIFASLVCYVPEWAAVYCWGRDPSFGRRRSWDVSYKGRMILGTSFEDI